MHWPFVSTHVRPCPRPAPTGPPCGAETGDSAGLCVWNLRSKPGQAPAPGHSGGEPAWWAFGERRKEPDHADLEYLASPPPIPTPPLVLLLSTVHSLGHTHGDVENAW